MTAATRTSSSSQSRRRGSPPSRTPTCATSSSELLAGDPEVLAERFTGRLQFGTAGLRAAVAAGPQRMNRLVVRQAAAGLVDHLLATEPDARTRGVIIGYDMRRKSDAFALDTARVCAARGVRAMIFRIDRADAGARVEHHRRRRRRRCDGDGEPQPAGRQRVQGVPRHRRADRAACRPRDLGPDRPRRRDAPSSCPPRTTR